METGALIELRSDVARLLRVRADGERVCEREVSLSALLGWLAARAVAATGCETPLLVPGTRAVHRLGDKTVVVIEQPPQRRRVVWANAGEDASLPEDAPVPRWLAFPYVVILLSFENGEADGYHQLYYRVAPLDTLDAPLQQANLLNVTTGRGSPAHWLCIGQAPLQQLDWPTRLERALESLWDAPFNLDFEVPRGSGYTRLRRIDPRIASAAAWEEASRADPLFPLHVAWPSAGLTLREAVAESLASTARPRFPDDLASLADALYRVPPAD
jgi:hypothetical protein